MCGNSKQWDYWSGAWEFEGPQLEPDEAHCGTCGFEWSQHCKNDDEALVDAHRLAVVAEGKASILRTSARLAAIAALQAENARLRELLAAWQSSVAGRERMAAAGCTPMDFSQGMHAQIDAQVAALHDCVFGEGGDGE